ncbi:MAG TPA: PadR family transcriptional regulator [Actinomycetota bacterium]|nr:PadR family transcriptional regulator [Actinomycetota bacterium]
MGDLEGPLPAATFHILLALTDGPKHGYAIMQRVEDLSDGSVRMGPGTLYGTVKRMVTDGLIEEVAGPDGEDDRRRTYRLTAAGQTSCAAEVRRLSKLLSDAAVKRWSRGLSPGTA